MGIYEKHPVTENHLGSAFNGFYLLTIFHHRYSTVPCIHLQIPLYTSALDSVGYHYLHRMFKYFNILRTNVSSLNYSFASSKVTCLLGYPE